MPEFNRQRIALRSPQQLPQRTNILGAVGAGLSQIGAAIERREQLEAEDNRKRDIAQAQADSLVRQEAMLEGDLDAKAQVQAGGTLDGFIENGRKRREDYDNDIFKDKSQDYIDASRTINRLNDINSMGRDATFVGTTRLRRSKDAIDNSGKALSLNTDLSVQGVFDSMDIIRETGSQVGADPNYTNSVVTQGAKDNLRTQITTPGNENIGEEILQDDRVKELFSSQEISDMEFIIQKNKADAGARFITEARGNALSASSAVFGVVEDGGSYDQAMSVLSNTDLTPVEREYMESTIRKWYGITGTDTQAKDPQATVKFIDASFNSLALGANSDLKTLLKDEDFEKKDSADKALLIDPIMDKAKIAMDEARDMFSRQVISPDEFNKLLIDYDELTDLGMQNMSPDTNSTLSSDRISARINSEIDDINSGRGVYKDNTEQEKAILRTSLRDFIISNNFLDQTLEPRVIVGVTNDAVSAANQALDDFKYPGVSQEKRDRIREAEQTQASTPSKARPTNTELRSVLQNPSIPDQDIIEWMKSRGMTEQEIENLIDNRSFVGPPTPGTQQ